MNTDQPLSEADLDELDAFLMADSMPEEAMDIAMLDGFFTALAIGPNLPMPSQWLPVVWGETEQESVKFKDEAQAQRILSLVMHMYNDRIHDLQEGVDEYVPLIYERQEDGQSIPIIDEWCTGFVRGIYFDAEGWQKLVESDDEQAAALLTPMLLYGTDDGYKELQENKALQERHLDLVDSIGPCVIGIRDFWLPIRKVASTFRREEDKIGRNDLCPCGSGKKFKRCCGSPDALQ